MTGIRGKDWIVLRTAPSSTVKLARALEWAAYDVWTPVQTVDKRWPRSTKRRSVDVPLTPTFVFVQAHHLDEMQAIIDAPTSPYPLFSILRLHGHLGNIRDRDLEPLREEERKAAIKPPEPVYVPGDEVTCDQAGFEGLTGIVEGVDGKLTAVLFPGKLGVAVKITTSNLVPVHVESPQPEQGTAAQAA